MSSHAFTVESFSYLRRDEPRPVLAVCADGITAIGLALRLIDMWGGEWRYDPLRSLWERMDAVPNDDGDDAVSVGCYPLNELPWRAHHAPDGSTEFLSRTDQVAQFTG